MSFYTIMAFLLLAAGIALYLIGRVGQKPEMSKNERDNRMVMKLFGGFAFTLALIVTLIGSVAIIQTGKAGVVRVVGVVQEETLGEGWNWVPVYAVVNRQETRGFQIDQTGNNALEVLTRQGARFHIEAGIPVKLNPESVALIESRIENGDWQSEVTSLARGLVRTNVSSYATFGEFNTRRSAVPGVEVIIEDAIGDTPAITRTWDVAYGEELAGQIETQVNGLFCDTYQICGVEAVDVGSVVIRKVIPPAAVTSEAAALDAAQLAKQTELALNEVEEIRANRRTQEGNGYGNLFAFLPDGATLSAGDAADFLRAAATKTQADADAYMQRQLAESITGAMEKGQQLPNLFITTGGGTSPVPVFNAPVNQ